MSDRPGLSIFEDPDDNGGERNRDDEATQVIPAVRPQGRPTPTPQAQPSASTPRPESGPAAGGSGRPSFPVVRRGGYDPASVDRQIHTLAGEKAGLTAGLNEAKSKVAETLDDFWGQYRYNLLDEKLRNVCSTVGQVW